MNGRSNARSTRFGELIVDRDRSTTVMLVVLFVFLITWLAFDIRGIFWGASRHLQINGWFNRLGVVFALYCLAVLFRGSSRLAKIGCVLFAAHLSLALVVTYLRVSLAARPGFALADFATVQISLVAFLGAIADWFRTVVRWSPLSPEEPGKR